MADAPNVAALQADKRYEKTGEVRNAKGSEGIRPGSKAEIGQFAASQSGVCK